MSWYSGSHVTPTSSPVISKASPKARMLASRLACDSATPFGEPVLPDVYWISASASAFETTPESRSTPESNVTPESCRMSGTVATVVRVGASGRRSAAARSASANVSRTRAPALRRIAAWRAAYSSI